MTDAAGRRRLVVFTHAGGSPYHGPNMRWYYLGRVLQSLGWEVDIVSASSFHKYHQPPVISKTGEVHDVDGLKYYWMRTRSYDGHGFRQILNQWDYTSRAWWFAGTQCLGRVDRVIASSPHPFAVFPAWRLARRHEAKWLFETRDLWPSAIQELGGFSKLNPYMVLLSRVERFAVQHADALVSVKPGEWEYFNARYGIARERQHYMPNGFLPIAEDDCARIARPVVSGIYTVGYVGALSKYYSLDTLLEAAHLLRGQDIRVVIVGSGPDGPRLKADAAKFGLSNVEFSGHVGKSDIPSLLASFDLCYLGLKDLQANQYGISCNKLFDYMDAGKPVLASYNTRYDPVATARCGITVPPADVQAVADAILWMRDHPDEAVEMGQRGKSYFAAEHDFRQIATRYDSLLRS